MDNEIKELLERYRRIAVVGLSPDPSRPSFNVSDYMKRAGYKIIPINPSCTEILGEKAYPTLEQIPQSEYPIEIVDIFRKSEVVPEIVDAAIRIGAKVIWMQESVVHDEAAKKASAAGLKVIMDRCILKEHVRNVVNRRAGEK